MYSASTEFHNAVLASNPTEQIRVSMQDLVFDNADLVASNLVFTEAINNDTNLVLGSCASSTLEFKVLNESGFLSDYVFNNEATVSLGVKTSEASTTYTAPYAIYDYGTAQAIVFEGHDTAPCLTANGVATEIQPPFAVKAIIIEDEMIYCVSSAGEIWMCSYFESATWGDLAPYTWQEASAITWGETQDGVYLEKGLISLNAFMQAKALKWATMSRGAWRSGNTLYEFTDNNAVKYEFVPLGVFVPEQPERKRVAQIKLTFNDRMILFEKDATGFLSGLSFPMTLGSFAKSLCTYVGVPFATGTFTNSSLVLDGVPFSDEETTCREILKWIAEASGSMGKINRDGELELVWFESQSFSLPMNQYFNIDVAEYEVQPIDKLEIRNSDDEEEIGVVIGEGENGYQIINNPFLVGASDEAIRTLATPIYNTLSSFNAYNPIKTKAVCDWSVEAGDIISVVLNGQTYSLPIFTQTISWNSGGARVVYESTGEELRPVMSATNRWEYNQKSAVHKLSVTVDGFSSRIEDVEGSVASLEFTTEGLDLAIKNNKLAFNEDGLSVYGGGLSVYDSENNEVFGVDDDGSIQAVGTFTTKGYDHMETPIQTVIGAGEIAFYRGNDTENAAGYISDGAAYLQSVSANNIDIITPDGVYSMLPMIQAGQNTVNTTVDISFTDDVLYGYDFPQIPTVILQAKAASSTDTSYAFALKTLDVTTTGFTVKASGTIPADGISFDWVAFCFNR